MSASQAELTHIYERVEVIARDLERILVDGATVDESFDEVLADCIADARHMHLDTLVERLENARYLVARLPDVGESEKLPAIFALQDGARPDELFLNDPTSHGIPEQEWSDTGAAHDDAPADQHLILDVGDDRVRLLTLDSVQMRALGRRLRLGETAWIVTIEGPIDSDAVQARLESELSVVTGVRVRFGSNIARLRLLVVSVDRPDPAQVEHQADAPSGTVTVNIESVGLQDLTAAAPGGDPGDEVCSLDAAVLDIERLQVLRWIHHQRVDSQPAVTRAMQVAVDDVLSVAFRNLAAEGLSPLDQRAAALGVRAMVRVVGDRQIDATSAQALRTLLAELCANAVDHGIEPETVRRGAAKREVGEIVISVHETDTGYEVRVADDGRGVDQARVDERSREESPGGLVRMRTIARERLGATLRLRSGSTGATAIIAVPGRSIRFGAMLIENRGTLWALPTSLVVRTFERTEGTIVSDGDGWLFFRHDSKLYRVVSAVVGGPTTGATLVSVSLDGTQFVIAGTVKLKHAVVAVSAGSKVIVPAMDGAEAVVPDLSALVAAVQMRAVTPSQDARPPVRATAIGKRDNPGDSFDAVDADADADGLEDLAELDEADI